MPYCLPQDYASRPATLYYDDAAAEDSAVVHQPEVYELAAALAQRLGARHVLDIGCGSARKLATLPGVTKIGVDFGGNLDFCRAHYPDGIWIACDLDQAHEVRIDAEILQHTIVICSDVVEHLLHPEHVLGTLRQLAGQTLATLISTPDRERVHGPAHRGPPRNPSHIREWSLREFEQLLVGGGLQPSFLGYTVNNDRDRQKNTILAVADGIHAPVRALEQPPLAIIACYNDADFIDSVVRHSLAEGVDVHVLDNWSDDGTFEQLLELAQAEPERVRVERFPAEGAVATYEWTAILQRKAAIAARHPGRWIVHQDSDEIRKSPWPRLTLAQGFAIAEAAGFNAIDFTVVEFRPVADLSAQSRIAPDAFRHFEFGRQIGHFTQIKAWRQLAPLGDAFVGDGGHEAPFAGRRVYPYKFLNLHYPLRSPAQARAKVFRERKARFSTPERAKGWHKQYDDFDGADHFLWAPDSLEAFDPAGFYRDYLVEIISGIGAPHGRVGRALKTAPGATLCAAGD